MTLRYFCHADFIEQHVTPSSSIDGLSLDEGVESKGSTDETAILGVSPSVYVKISCSGSGCSNVG